MAMESTDTNMYCIVLKTCRKFIGLYVLSNLIFFSASISATDWKIVPSISVSEVYSDNINLDMSGNEQSAFVTDVSPGVSIRRKKGRNDLNLDYRMQNLHNAGGSDKLDMLHQLRFNSDTELLKNSVFLDLNSSISQQNATNINSSNDNVAGNRNRTNVFSYKISPYWEPHFNGYADGEVRFSYDHLITDNSAASNSRNLNYSAYLKSGKRFSLLTWFIDFERREENRVGGDDVIFQDTLIELRGHINRHFSVFTQLGHSHNSFITTTDDNKNGFFYSFGGAWKPSERLVIEAAGGNNTFVSVDIMPIRHMHWLSTYRINDIGTNTGHVWESSLDFRTKRSVWKVSYSEDTTTIQDELTSLQSFDIRDDFDVDIINPNPELSDISLQPLIDEVVLTKKAEFSVSYKTGKSDLNLRVFSSRSTFQLNQTKNNVTGVNGSWNWRFERRTSLLIRPSWQHLAREGSKDDRYDVTLALTRTIPVALGSRSQLNASVEYSFLNQISDIITNEFTENRVSANLRLSF